MTNPNIYRYKFDPEIVELISNFSKLHQFDSREDFKEAWKVYIDTNKNLIENEKERLNSLNYKGDIDSKLFKAARYYFRKKALINKEENENLDFIEEKNNEKKRGYICLSVYLLDLMDEHITSNINNTDYTPANGYLAFCNINNNSIEREIKILLEDNDNILSEDINKKIKKAYKNRYYQYITHK